VKELSQNGKAVFRPYKNTTTYDASDCLKNPDPGDAFIVGHMTNVYPAFSGLPAHTDHTFLITGEHSDGVGPKEQPYFDGVIGYGYHVLQK
jgi:hypothetical protein